MKNVPSCKTICWTKWAIKSFAKHLNFDHVLLLYFFMRKNYGFIIIFCFFIANLHCLLSAIQNNIVNKKINYALINLRGFAVATRHPYSQWDELVSEEAFLFLTIFLQLHTKAKFFQVSKFFSWPYVLALAATE